MSDVTTKTDEWDDEPDPTCPECNEDCGYEERGYCILDECKKCGKWLENCDCEGE